MFEDKILKGALNMVAPDAELSGELHIFESIKAKSPL